jgi:hypothetical protein
MKRFLFSLLFISAAVLSKAQTVDEVIAKHIEAMGGKEKLNSIQSLHMVGISTGRDGNEVTTNIWKVHNKLFRRESNMGMGSMRTILTEKGGWQTNFRSGGSLEQMAEPMFNNTKYEMDCAGPLVDYAAKGHKAELLGKETIDGKEVYKIKLTTKEGRELTYFIDASSHYITRLSFKRGGRDGQEVEVAVNFTNYDKTKDGFIFPFSQSMTGGFGASMTFEKIEVNPVIDEKLYKPE